METIGNSGLTRSGPSVGLVQDRPRPRLVPAQTCFASCLRDPEGLIPKAETLSPGA